MYLNHLAKSFENIGLREAAKVIKIYEISSVLNLAVFSRYELINLTIHEEKLCGQHLHSIGS